MKKMTSVLFLALMFLSVELTQANEKRGAVPSKVLSAKTIYVDNQTTDAELQHDASPRPPVPTLRISHRAGAKTRVAPRACRSIAP